MGARSALLLRLSLLAVTLLLGVGALALRPSSHHVKRPPRTQLNGRTSQGFVVYGLKGDGRIRGMHLVWRGRCTGGDTIDAASVNVEDTKIPFRRSGRSFSVASHPLGYARSHGWIEQTVVVRGKLSANGRSASGTLLAQVAWAKHNRAGGTCNSGPVRWRLATPA
jgi:hypothetical protein